jgi:hypothetical protein
MTERDPNEPVPDQTDLPEGTAAENPERERTSIDAEPEPAEDDLLRREEDAAAAEAGRIGGPGPDYEGSEEDRPLAEGGEGEAEGFEQAERELEEQASHGDSYSVPGDEGFGDEDSRANTVYGEPDEVDPTEVTSDPREGPDDPGAGPGIAADR